MYVLARDLSEGLRRFVTVEAIPPLYFERGYFLGPGGESMKAYQLLAAVMEKTRRAGIGQWVSLNLRRVYLAMWRRKAASTSN